MQQLRRRLAAIHPCSAIPCRIGLTISTNPAVPHDPWRLMSARFPRRLDLELTDDVYESLQRLSVKTKRSMRDLAADLICRQIVEPVEHR
jgi:hypothetical protein